MKKILTFIITAFFIGCTGLPSVPSSTSSPAVLNKVSEYVDLKSEIYGLGSNRISSAGTFVAEGKAKKESLVKLKKNVANEVDIYFNDFLKNVDPYSKSMFLSSKNELKNYAIDSILLNASQKETFNIDNKIYMISTVERKDVFEKSKFTFLEYTSNIKKRLENIYSDVNTNSFENINDKSSKNSLIPETITPEESPLNNDTTVSSTDFTSLEDDPLFL